LVSVIEATMRWNTYQSCCQFHNLRPYMLDALRGMAADGERVAVMGHSGVIERLLGTFPGNCEVIHKEI
jgi:hypothetical protein